MYEEEEEEEEDSCWGQGVTNARTAVGVVGGGAGGGAGVDRDPWYTHTLTYPVHPF